MVETGRDWLCLAVALLACAASAAHAQAQQVSPARRAALADGAAAKAFCASPEFKSLQCGWASEKELKLTASNQCGGRPLLTASDVRCDERAQQVPGKLPAVLAGHPTGGPPSYAARALSLACKGRIVTRAVFKLLSVPARPARGTAVVLSNRPAGSVGPTLGTQGPAAPSERVRCKLQLPAGAEPEAGRALKAKEVDCVECRASACPAVVGTWYRWVALRSAVLGDWGRPHTQPREKHTHPSPPAPTHPTAQRLLHLKRTGLRRLRRRIPSPL
jgi:hypothetical protein